MKHVFVSSRGACTFPGSFTGGLILLWLALAMPANGQLGYDFNIQQSAPVYTLAVQPDGRIFVGNLPDPSRLHPDGTVDLSFNPSVHRSVYTVTVPNDGSILVGGGFDAINGQPHTNLAHFFPDGSLNTNFTVAARSTVFALAAQPDGKILVGGTFTHLGNELHSGIGRLLANGAPDSSFDAQINGVLFTIAVQPDGKILAGGEFTLVNGQPRTNFVRLNPDATLDTNFFPLGVKYVFGLAGQADGKILLGASIEGPSGVATNLVRLNPDGTLDTSFNPRANSVAWTLAVQADGKIIAGGPFTSMGGQPRSRLGRINADGSLDTSFIAPDYTRVHCVGLQDDGKILVGGDQANQFQQTNSYFGRLQNTGPAAQSLTREGSKIIWMRGGTAPEVWCTSFATSVDGTNWTDIGAGDRISGGWQLFAVGNTSNLFVRARGWVSVGQFNGVNWFVQSVLPPVLTILTDNESFGFRSNLFGFDYTAPSNKMVVVEGSADLLVWKPITTNSVGATPVYFSDPASSAVTRRFYRLRLQP